VESLQPDKCPFCTRLASGEVDHRYRSAAAFEDGFPLSAGHTLVLPSRHQPDFFSLSAEEQADVWWLVAQVRLELERQLAPDGFTVGLNDGVAAGQTIDHAHVHVIPRTVGDVADPRGGLRWVLPAKAAYWSDD
jgi:diadenosine tetraphosphate (Ap4A) HIT family hydrolase